MALLFQRLARNYAKNGYFPTDGETLARMLSALVPAKAGAMRILDPCCGEGTALVECKNHLGADRTVAYGIEFNEARAWQAKTALDRCIHADFQNCIIGQRGFGLLFLNPPYGDLVADKGETGDKTASGRQRLEKLFYSRSLHTLQFGGVLALIIPYYSLDKALCEWIARHFTRVAVFLAPEDRFKQVVIFGVRKRGENTEGDAALCECLLSVGKGALPPVLPEVWQAEPYVVPAIAQPEVTFVCISWDARQLRDEICKHPCLWPQFAERFNKLPTPARRPLMPLSNWHLALALAAGQVAGLVTSRDGRTFLIKGDTYKEARETTAYERTEQETVTVVTHLDRFIPVIRALNVTPQSQSYGAVLIIK